MMRIALALLTTIIVNSASAAECSWAAPDNTGRVWAHREHCSVQSSPSLGTEIIVGARDAFWSVTGSVGRHIVPGYNWTKRDGWVRDTNRDQVLWMGGAKPSSSSCHADGSGPRSGWDFSNGMRICVSGGGR